MFVTQVQYLGAQDFYLASMTHRRSGRAQFFNSISTRNDLPYWQLPLSGPHYAMHARRRENKTLSNLCHGPEAVGCDNQVREDSTGLCC